MGRVRPAFEREQIADLLALGLDWDGAPVRQSERHPLYAEALARLEAEGRLYPCYCTRAEIRQAASAPHGPGPEGAYPGTCRDLGPAEWARRAATGRPPALRLRAETRTIEWVDRLLGPQRGEVDDLVMRRGDGVPAYNLAVVVDDADQGVTEVVRGADLVHTTPRQIAVAHALGLGPPASYAHVPLVLGPDGTRLAKRHGAVTMGDRAALGESPARVLAALAASVGLAGPGETITPAELLERFDPAELPREPTRWTGPTSATA